MRGYKTGSIRIVSYVRDAEAHSRTQIALHIVFSSALTAMCNNLVLNTKEIDENKQCSHGI